MEPARGVVDENDIQHRLVALAEELRASGDLRGEVWREVFTRVWRHTFVPRFYVKDDPQDWRTPWRVVDSTRPGDRKEWLEGVYSNETLITELMDQPVPKELGGGTAQVITSSSTLPGLMVSMLDTLDVRDGHHVLEIGTGSGYNAALLSARLGDQHVTSVDIGPAVVDAARCRLATHGFHPHLSTCHGAQGVPERAPFDRIIATCGVPRIPDAWVQQTRPGGIILANLSGPLMGGALARLRVTDDGTAVGGFQPGFGAFIPLREHPDRPSTPPPRPTLADDGVETASRLSPHLLHPIGYSGPWGFVVQTVLPGLRVRRIYLLDDDLATELSTPDGSWAAVGHTPQNGSYRTIQGGPRRLWDLLETTHQRWRELGEPGWERFGLTVTPHQQQIWLDTPDGEQHWSLAYAQS
ncbi:MAG: ATP-grasp peptide maturase system methyltransferase [Pseudonocardiales bacterium]|nr:ATP-grasp peptide maturase system methyltransferase [Pseudonocardiales bacterium]